MRSVVRQHEGGRTQRISRHLLHRRPQRSAVRHQECRPYTTVSIRSGTCSLAWLITIPPRLWPTNTTGPGYCLTKFAKRAQKSSVIPDNAVLSRSIPGRSGPMTRISPALEQRRYTLPAPGPVPRATRHESSRRSSSVPPDGQCSLRSLISRSTRSITRFARIPRPRPAKSEGSKFRQAAQRTCC
jgi:hypothetical protein